MLFLISTGKTPSSTLLYRKKSGNFLYNKSKTVIFYNNCLKDTIFILKSLSFYGSLPKNLFTKNNKKLTKLTNFVSFLFLFILYDKIKTSYILYTCLFLPKMVCKILTLTNHFVQNCHF